MGDVVSKQLYLFPFFGPGSSLKKVWGSEDHLELSVFILTGSFIAFAMEVTEFLVVWHTSSLTLAVSGIVKVSN